MRTFLILTCVIAFAESAEVVPEVLNEISVTTQLDAIHKFSIQDYAFVTSETCRIITPNGDVYDLKSEAVPYIELYTSTDSACGVKITVNSEDFVGNWTLTAKGQRFNTPIERRLPIVIVVEETAEAFPSEVTVAEGNNFHISLANPTTLSNTCKLLRPDGIEHEANITELSNTCSYDIHNVTTEHNGTWTIEYGNKIIYKAPVQVTVVETSRNNTIHQSLHWSIGAPVKQLIGPEDAIYCKITDAHRKTVFEGFERCNISIERVTSEHAGVWKMAVGVHGSVLPEETTFTVVVEQPDTKPTVITTNVVEDKPSVTISCSVQSEYAIKACKFRDPSGRVLLAHEGVSQSRYRFHGSAVRSYESDAQNHTCGLHITDPAVADVGLWRCGVETEAETHYGHLFVRCPWLITDVEVLAAIITEPTLTAERSSVTALEDESVTLSCSIQAAIRYCYFRTRNGTLFHVSPGQSNYVGAGFEAGECGIRFPGLSLNDSGSWSCHVGLTDPTAPEQRRPILLSIEEPLTVRQLREGNNLQIVAQVYQQRKIDYCVFVRIDGLGFTMDNAPSGYHCMVHPSEGYCELRITSPSILDYHPWTVMAKISGRDGDVAKVTEMILNVPKTFGSQFSMLWVILITVGLSMLFVSLILSSQKNRKWAASRASSLRNSFRYSLRKPPLGTNNTPVAA